mmetsp:Transcript_32562/g.80588  ORF Transcript_32562/g.80588 Transcript_32562/m.80588 type:complete len:275 (-) Transcript_32562:281-1105(-)
MGVRGSHKHTETLSISYSWSEKGIEGTNGCQRESQSACVHTIYNKAPHPLSYPPLALGGVVRVCWRHAAGHPRRGPSVVVLLRVARVECPLGSETLVPLTIEEDAVSLSILPLALIQLVAILMVAGAVAMRLAGKQWASVCGAAPQGHLVGSPLAHHLPTCPLAFACAAVRPVCCASSLTAARHPVSLVYLAAPVQCPQHATAVRFAVLHGAVIQSATPHDRLGDERASVILLLTSQLSRKLLAACLRLMTMLLRLIVPLPIGITLSLQLISLC